LCSGELQEPEERVRDRVYLLCTAALVVLVWGPTPAARPVRHRPPAVRVPRPAFAYAQSPTQSSTPHSHRRYRPRSRPPVSVGHTVTQSLTQSPTPSLLLRRPRSHRRINLAVAHGVPVRRRSPSRPLSRPRRLSPQRSRLPNHLHHCPRCPQPSVAPDAFS
jgi:hypothetical protein